MDDPLARICFAAALACSSLAQTQNQTPTIRVNVDLVSVNVRVTDKQNRDVPQLSADDFDLLEDGRKQKIAFFDTNKEPITLSILVDSSSSMGNGGKLDAAQIMLRELMNSLRPEDEVSLMQFTDRIVSFKKVAWELWPVALSSSATAESGGTALYDAVASALCRLREAKNLRQAIVVFTDGADQHSRIKLEQLIRLVQRSRAQLFMIGFFQEPEYRVYKESGARVALVTGRDIDNPLIVFERLARESGAEAFFPTDRKTFDQVVRDISNILRAQYTLAYYPLENPRNIRRIQVKVHRRGVRIRAREAIGLQNAALEEIQFDGGTCQVSDKAYPFPYESRLTQSGVTYTYREDFSDPDTGWPNRAGSRYTANGYELSYEPPKQEGDKRFVLDTARGSLAPAGIGALAAYGPWWSDFRASVSIDAGWAKMRAPSRFHSLKSKGVLDDSSAGLIFGVEGAGYYAFLLSSSAKAYEADELSFKLVRRTFGDPSERPIIPWTRVAADQVQKEISAGIKLTVECKGDQITLFVDDMQVSEVREVMNHSGYLGFISLGTGHAWFKDMRVEGTR
jgi:Ca-activated chloride channel family protein